MSKQNLERISRTLTKILRHDAPKRGIKYDIHGGVSIDIMLSLPDFKKFNINKNILFSIVNTCSKQRFKIYIDENNVQRICANQGHSYKVIPFSSTKITLDNIDTLEINTDTIVHGTYYNVIEQIKRDGLSRMSRTDIHFGINVPEADEVLSGMRASCEVMIFIDIYKALNDGIEFTLSDNKVVLTPGNKDGYLLPKYFTSIVDRKNRKII